MDKIQKIQMLRYMSEMLNVNKNILRQDCLDVFGRFLNVQSFLTIVCVMLFSVTACEMPDTGFGSVRGRVVRMPSGEPISGVMVVYGDSAVYTDDNGEYIYENLPEHKQTLRFDVDGHRTVFQQVAVIRNKTVSCDVEMSLIVSAWAVGKVDSEYGTILHSVDGGKSWIRRGSQSSVPSVELTDVCAVGEDACWVVGDKDDFSETTVILKTTDGGISWINEGRNVSGVPPIALSAVFAKNADTAWAVAADTCLILNTRNGGKSWNVCNESAMMRYYTAITSPDGFSVWCSGLSIDGSPAVEYSPDGGRTWTYYVIRGLSGNQKVTDVCAVDSETLYAAASVLGGVLFSQDAGKTWTVLSKVIPTADMVALDVFDRENIRILENGGNVYLTHDAFETVSVIKAVDAGYSSGIATSIDFMRDGIGGALSVLSSIGATGVIYYTTDGGLTWQKSMTPFDFAINSLDFVGGMN